MTKVIHRGLHRQDIEVERHADTFHPGKMWVDHVLQRTVKQEYLAILRSVPDSRRLAKTTCQLDRVDELDGTVPVLAILNRCGVLRLDVQDRRPMMRQVMMRTVPATSSIDVGPGRLQDQLKIVRSPFQTPNAASGELANGRAHPRNGLVIPLMHIVMRMPTFPIGLVDPLATISFVLDQVNQ